MKTTSSILGISLLFLIFISCSDESLNFSNGDIEIQIETGEHWLHDFPLIGELITKKNPPQFAIWIEDTTGHYLTTLFATYKIATEGWVSNKGNRRKEALPHWCHQRGFIDSDGLYLPTKDVPLTDGITGATPIEDKTLLVKWSGTQPFVIKAEFNHSVDFNNTYNKNLKPGDKNYSGGDEGSGQPSVIYSKTIDFDSQTYTLNLIGHGSPDGTDGRIYSNLSDLTTSTSIVKEIRITLH